MDKKRVTQALNDAMNLEIEGAVEYLYLSFNVFGHSRRLLQGFLREQAQEGMDHATKMAEKLTALGGTPELKVQIHYKPEKLTARQILARGLEREKKALELYRSALPMADDDVSLEDLLRSQIASEQEHCEEVEKLLREE
jgi:bacterioferritin